MCSAARACRHSCDVYSLDADIVELLHDVLDLKLVGAGGNSEHVAVLLLAVGGSLFRYDRFDLNIHGGRLFNVVNDADAIFGEEDGVIVEHGVGVQVDCLCHERVGHVAHREKDIAVHVCENEEDLLVIELEVLGELHVALRAGASKVKFSTTKICLSLALEVKAILRARLFIFLLSFER